MNISVKRFTLIAMLLAMTIVLSSFSIPVPGGHLYFNDLVIVTAALNVKTLLRLFIDWWSWFIPW